MHTIEMETTSLDTDGLATAILVFSRLVKPISYVTNLPIPPTALVTDTAAVRMPSAMVKPVPKRAWFITCHLSSTRRHKKKIPRSTSANEKLWEG